MSELRVTDGAFVCKWGKNGGAGGMEKGIGSQEGEFGGPEAVGCERDDWRGVRERLGKPQDPGLRLRQEVSASGAMHSVSAL